jgi:hypothetical protein
MPAAEKTEVISVILREGPRLKGGYSGGSGSGVPPYDFLNLYGVSDCRFCASFS